MKRATTLATAADRAAYRRQKKQSLREARMTERLERQQRMERERRLKQKHLDYLQTIVNHGRDMASWHRAHQRRQANLARLVVQQHVTMEREEQRRAERAAKERLKALKADDEETYMKLVSEAKNDRLRHLLSQTDAYLETLANAVKEQQNSVGGAAEQMMRLNDVDEEEDLNKRTDYYSVAHRIRETVTEQPSILVGGKLKEYQIRGLEWMTSLYNNRLNGILAGVHVIMYYYFYLASRGIRVWWKQYITTMQITQFVLDLMVVYMCMYNYYASRHFSFLPYTRRCDGFASAGGMTAAVLLTIYLALFVQMYRDTYIRGTRKRETTKLSSKTQ